MRRAILFLDPKEEYNEVVARVRESGKEELFGSFQEVIEALREPANYSDPVIFCQIPARWDVEDPKEASKIQRSLQDLIETLSNNFDLIIGYDACIGVRWFSLDYVTEYACYLTDASGSVRERVAELLRDVKCGQESFSYLWDGLKEICPMTDFLQVL